MTLAIQDAAAPVQRRIRWALDHAVPRIVMGRVARAGDLQGLLITGGSEIDPFPLFNQMRASGPVHRGRIGLVATSHEVCREVLASNDFHTGIERSPVPGPLRGVASWARAAGPVGPLTPPSLLVVEPPDHTRYRRLVTRVFTVKAVDRLRGRAEQVAAELLDQLADQTDDPSDDRGDDVDLVARYCALLPVTMIAEILGVPPEQRELVLGFGEAAAPSLDIGLSWRDFSRVEASLRDFEGWLTQHIAGLRENPGTDLLSQLVMARDNGVGLNDTEVKATAGLVLAAGFETTVNLLSNGVKLLLDHPDQLAELRRSQDSSGWRNAVEEILRYDPPVLLTGRTAHAAVRIAGQQIRVGSMVTTALAAANRDPAVFADPDVFDVDRPNAAEHISFSGGRHFCLGASLARMEGEVGLAALLTRYPSMQLLPGAERRSTRILRGFKTLPVRLGAPALSRETAAR